MLRRSIRHVRNYSTVQSVGDSLMQIPPNSTVFSMIQPTGRFHLGNYLGAIKSWKTISESGSEGSKYIYGIADLHAITMSQDAQQLKQNRYEAMASLIASGLDVEKCTLFHQSSVPEHTELNWVLTCKTSMGHLNRMTQWKLKSGSNSLYDEKMLDKTKAGLLCYPILQAADVLLYNSTHVPVGEDQAQHLELTRSIANTFNHDYKQDFFTIPRTLLAKNQKVLSLGNPQKKMSKSDLDQNACVYITETPEEIARKIKRAVTDSIQGPITYDVAERPGVSNLITIVSGLTGKSVSETVTDLAWIQNHKQLKDHVTEIIVEEFKPKRHLFDQLMTDKAYIEKISTQGRDKAREIALKNMEKVREIIGMD